MLFTAVGNGVKALWNTKGEDGLPYGMFIVLGILAASVLALAINGHLVTLFAFLIGVYIGENEEIFTTAAKTKTEDKKDEE